MQQIKHAEKLCHSDARRKTDGAEGCDSPGRCQHQTVSSVCGSFYESLECSCRKFAPCCPGALARRRYYHMWTSGQGQVSGSIFVVLLLSSPFQRRYHVMALPVLYIAGPKCECYCVPWLGLEVFTGVNNVCNQIQNRTITHSRYPVITHALIVHLLTSLCFFFIFVQFYDSRHLVEGLAFPI